METGSLESNVMTSLNIAELYEKLNLHGKAHEYRELSKLYEDSLQKRSQIETSDNIRNIEKNADIQKQNEELAKDRSISNIIICIMIAVVLFIAIATRRYLKEQKRKNEIERKREILETKAALLKNDNERLRTKQKEKALLEMEIRQSEIYQKFHTPTFKPSSNDFILLEESLNKAYYDFAIRLKELCPTIRIQELQLCCLMKIGLSSKDISRILSCQPSTLSMMKKRLFFKLSNKEGGANDLHDMICNL